MCAISSLSRNIVLNKNNPAILFNFNSREAIARLLLGSLLFVRNQCELTNRMLGMEIFCFLGAFYLHPTPHEKLPYS